MRLKLKKYLRVLRSDPDHDAVLHETGNRLPPGVVLDVLPGHFSKEFDGQFLKAVLVTQADVLASSKYVLMDELDAAI